MPTIHFIGPRDANGYPLQFVEGVPARDLTPDEYAALPDDQRALVRDSPLYDYANTREARKADRTQDEPQPVADEPAPVESTSAELSQAATVDQGSSTKTKG